MEPASEILEKESKREIFNSYNSLLCVAQGVCGYYTTIDLRNDSQVSGRLEQVDGFMNAVVSDALFTDSSGNEFYYEQFFVKERNIRYIHVPEEISIPDVIDRKVNPKPKRKKPVTLKGKKLMQRQKETLARVRQIKLERERKKMESAEKEES